MLVFNLIGSVRVPPTQAGNQTGIKLQLATRTTMRAENARRPAVISQQIP